MDPDSISACLSQLNTILERREVVPGGLTHAISQLQTAFERSQHFFVDLEHSVNRTVTLQTEVGGQIQQIEVTVRRNIDVLAQSLERVIHTEVKTGRTLSGALDTRQLTNDATLALENIQSEATRRLENVWQFTNIQFGRQNLSVLQERVGEVARDLLGRGLDEQEVREAIESFQFVDRMGNAIRMTLDENQEAIFDPAMEIVFGSDGLLAQKAEEKAEKSPDFGPAMEILLGTNGTLADAAQDAAEGANMDSVAQSLEQAIEQDALNAIDPDADQLRQSTEQAIEESLEEAAGNVRTSAVAAVGESLSTTGQAITDLADNIGGVIENAQQLGEVWDRPNKGLSDYLEIASGIGGILSQAGGALSALASFTQVATAAQAAFNAVMAMNPIVLVVLAVVALIAAIAALIIYWDEVKAALRDNPWLAVIAVLFGVIGVIVVVIAYWDEIKLAVLRAANFISIQVQRIGRFFVGLGNLLGQVWDWIVGTIANAFIGIINLFIRFGISTMNFFIDFANELIDMANAVIEYIPGVEEIERISTVDVETNLIPPPEVPVISVEAAFASTEPITGGLEGAIAEQEAVVAAAQAEDEERRRREREAEAAAAAPAAPRVAELPARPALPEAAARAAPEQLDQSVQVEGGITVNINTDHLEVDAAEVLSDEIVRRLKAKLDALRTEQDFRTGVRTPAPA